MLASGAVVTKDVPPLPSLVVFRRGLSVRDNQTAEPRTTTESSLGKLGGVSGETGSLYCAFRQSRWSTSSLLKLVEHLPPQYRAQIIVPNQDNYAERLRQEHIGMHVVDLRQRQLPTLLWESWRSALVYGNNVDYCVSVAMQAAQIEAVRPFARSRIMPDVNTTPPDETNYLRRIRQFYAYNDGDYAVSKATAQGITRLLDGQRTPRVIYNGVDVNDFNLDRASSRQQILERLNGLPDAVLVVQVGYIDPRKNQLEGVEAFAAVVKHSGSAPDSAGDAEKDNAYTLQLQTRIHALGLDEHVILAGFHPDVRTFLCGADPTAYSTARSASTCCA